MHASTLVVGIGSAQGEDSVGWQVIEQLRNTPSEADRLAEKVRLCTLADPLRLLDELEGVQRLLLVDACQAGQEAGTVLRFDWPAPQLAARWGTSSHGIDVPAVLQLAEQLGRLPPRVVLFGIEVGSSEIPGVLARALPILCQQLHKEIGS